MEMSAKMGDIINGEEKVGKKKEESIRLNLEILVNNLK